MNKMFIGLTFIVLISIIVIIVIMSKSKKVEGGNYEIVYKKQPRLRLNADGGIPYKLDKTALLYSSGQIAPNEKWLITPMGNDTYTINTPDNIYCYNNLTLMLSQKDKLPLEMQLFKFVPSENGFTIQNPTGVFGLIPTITITDTSKYTVLNMSDKKDKWLEFDFVKLP